MGDMPTVEAANRAIGTAGLFCLQQPLHICSGSSEYSLETND